MKFLILFSLVALATADYHDDTFHFSSLGSQGSLSGLQRASSVQVSRPILAKQFSSFAAPALTKQYTTVQASPVYSSFVAQPAYRQQYTAVKQVAAAPLLVRNIEEEIPVYQQQQFAVKQIAQPVYQQQIAVKQIARPVYQQQYSVKQVSQPLVAQQYSAAALSGVSAYASAYNGPQYRILSQVQEADPAGPYKVSYSTENGIEFAEQGALVPSADGPVIAAQGSYSYTGPDGVLYSVNYIADENGFRAAGDHLPTPPPIPAEILRSLELNASNNEQYDDQGRLLSKK